MADGCKYLVPEVEERRGGTNLMTISNGLFINRCEVQCRIVQSLTDREEGNLDTLFLDNLHNVLRKLLNPIVDPESDTVRSGASKVQWASRLLLWHAMASGKGSYSLNKRKLSLGASISKGLEGKAHRPTLVNVKVRNGDVDVRPVKVIRSVHDIPSLRVGCLLRTTPRVVLLHGNGEIWVAGELDMYILVLPGCDVLATTIVELTVEGEVGI